MQLNSLVTPPQFPFWYSLLPQLTLAHVVHVPATVPDDPFRNWLVLHFGWSLHLKPSLVPEHVPERYLPPPQLTLLHVVHVPLVVASDPRRYSPLLHVGWTLHVADACDFSSWYMPAQHAAHDDGEYGDDGDDVLGGGQ